MEKQTLSYHTASGGSTDIPFYHVHTMVIGSGAAGLNAAVQLRANSIDDVLIITEGLQMGTSINTGSDKQTYYKLGMCGAEPDAPEFVAEALCSGGSMHGDLALVEASLSARGFIHLVNLGVPFPRDAYGQFVGYKTDHDPRQRATSVGPYTSREMCRSLIREVSRLGIPVHENRLAVSLLVLEQGEEKRIAGAVVLNTEDASENGLSRMEVYAAENVVFAVGGPGGLYKTSVYPEVHTGGIGLGLLAGAQARNLPESQYGMASIGFRWNVSGSYMQVIPRFISTAPDGRSDEREFLSGYFSLPGEMNSAIFLKGYQWPFDTRKIIGGSSIIDILVYIETVLEGRRVFLDYRNDSGGFRLEELSAEARVYLERSKAAMPIPFHRLRTMNPDAVALYREHGIDLETTPLEIAVCAQHNNGGLAGNLWWESVNIKHLFPIGEVNGSHGVARPGGSALNAGQVGGFRAAEFIGHRCQDWTLDVPLTRQTAAEILAKLEKWILRSRNAPTEWRQERDELQSRMTSAGAHVRFADRVGAAVAEAERQWHRIDREGCRFSGVHGLREALNTRQLCYAHWVYLEAVLFSIQSGVGSRGSAMVLGADGVLPHSSLGDEWRFLPENTLFREKVLETFPLPDGGVRCGWVDRRPIPKTDAWFETTWAAFKKGEIYSPG